MSPLVSSVCDSAARPRSKSRNIRSAGGPSTVNEKGAITRGLPSL